MSKLTGHVARLAAIVAVGLSFGVGGVVGDAAAQSDTMKSDSMKHDPMTT